MSVPSFNKQLFELPSRREFLAITALSCTIGVSSAHTNALENTHDKLNILWLTTEDHSPQLGCYGDALANTPHIDQLAAEGIRYTNAFANTPVCAPARFTLLTGTHASTMGTLHMRSRYPIPEECTPYPELLRQAGYYCTNNWKTDYNFLTDDASHWDENGNDAHYKNRPDGKPFFAVFNFLISHEGQINDPVVEERRESGLLPERPRINPEDFPLPPYHPDAPEIREDWVRHYDNMDLLDRHVNERLKELEESGLAENTIVFFYSDHGGILARSKRFLYDTGTRVPLIIRFPKKWQHLAPASSGGITDRLISFVDFAPTLLSLTDIPLPSYMQGKPFLGKQLATEEKYAFLYRGRMDERYDFSRAITDGRFRYIRHFMPQRILGQHLIFPYEVQNNWSAWENACKAGRCNEIQKAFWEPKPVEELFDMQSDPWEVNNLVDSPEHLQLLVEMRKACLDMLLKNRDTGFIPESMFEFLAGNKTLFDYAQSEVYPLEDILEIADKATRGMVEYLPDLEAALSHRHPLIRYWGAMGCAILRERANELKHNLFVASEDEFPAIRVAAAEGLAFMGEKTHAIALLRKVVLEDYDMAATEALNVLDFIEAKDSFSHDELKSIVDNNGQYKYAQRIATHWIENYIEHN